MCEIGPAEVRGMMNLEARRSRRKDPPPLRPLNECGIGVIASEQHRRSLRLEGESGETVEADLPRLGGLGHHEALPIVGKTLRVGNMMRRFKNRTDGFETQEVGGRKGIDAAR